LPIAWPFYSSLLCILPRISYKTYADIWVWDVLQEISFSPIVFETSSVLGAPSSSPLSPYTSFKKPTSLSYQKVHASLPVLPLSSLFFLFPTI